MAEPSLDDLWSDPDRRDDALLRCLLDVHWADEQPKPLREILTPQQRRVLEALSRGLGQMGTAEVCGVTLESVKTHTKLARRKLRAKDTTHAVAIALRAGLIR